jgi:hypothetical protein
MSYNDESNRMKNVNEITDDEEAANLSIKTNLDPKSPFDNNPYFDKNKEYTEEELEKFRKFFGGS